MPHHPLSRCLHTGLILLVVVLTASGQTRPGAAPRAKPAAPTRLRLPARPRTILQGHDKAVETLAFAPDGKFLVSGAGDGTVRLWDAASGRERAKLRAGDADFIVEAAAVAPDGRTVAWGGTDGGIRLWDVTSTQVRKTLGSGRIMVLAYLPNGATLASGSYRTCSSGTSPPGRRKPGSSARRCSGPSPLPPTASSSPGGPTAKRCPTT